MLTLLFIGLAYATETSNDTISTDTATLGASTTEEVVYSSNTQIKEVDNTLTDKTSTKKIIKQDNGTKKTASQTYTVNDFNTLHNALTNDTYTNLTLNIKSNIILEDNTELNSAIKVLTINGNGKTINGNGQYQFLSISSDSKVTIKNIKITNCYAYYGGAIYNNYGNLTINNSTLNNNNASYGGVIYNYYNGTITITNSTLNNNKVNWFGGVIYNNNGNLTIISSTLCNNTNPGHIGGAIFNCWDLVIIDSKLNNNNANHSGGAIYNTGTVTIKNSILNNNSANGKNWEDCGGAIRNRGNLTIFNSILNDNKADYDGGAIYNFEGNIILSNSTLNNNIANNTGGAIRNCGNLTIIKTNINNNKAIGSYGGGAILNGHVYGANLTIIDSRLNNNTSNSIGGAIRNWATDNISIKNSTLNYNNANNSGGAINNHGNITIINSFLNYNNANNSGGAIYNGENLSITNNTLNNNKATLNGGAIFNEEGNNMKVINNNFTYNSAQQGSAIYSKGLIGYELLYGDNATIKNNLFTKNKANTTGKVIIDDGINTTIKNNTNADISIDSSTIYISGTNSLISNNIFDDGRSTSKITVGSTNTVPVGKQMSVYGKLTDNNGKNLAYQKITIKVDGKTYTTNTTQYGNYNIKITPTTSGIKTITAAYAGTNLYVSSTATTTFTANKTTTILTVGSTKIVPVGKQMSIYGKLTDNNTKDIANQLITIKVDGKTYTTNTTQYGNYKIQITPTTIGTKTITATYAGTTTYISSNATSTFTANKITTTITVGSTKTVPTGKQMSIYGKLTDQNGKDLAYQQVTINVDGDTFTVYTTDYGNYKIQITPTTVGTKTITATYTGTSTYLPSKATSTFTANKISTVLTVGSSKTVLVGKQMSVYGKLIDRDNKDIANQAITIKVDGKTYTTTTSEYGNYNIKITPTTTGLKTITASYAGTTTYLASTNSTTLQVKQS